MNTEIKSTRSWFNELPQPYRRLAVQETIKYRRLRNDNIAVALRAKHSSLLSAIGTSFTWSDSTQGRPFWESICDQLRRTNGDTSTVNWPEI